MRALLFLVLLAACGGQVRGDVTILSAPCDGGTASQPTATFTLPASFDAKAGDVVTGSFCGASCDVDPATMDGGGWCSGATSLSPAARVSLSCARFDVAPGQENCFGDEAFLQLTE